MSPRHRVKIEPLPKGGGFAFSIDGARDPRPWPTRPRAVRAAHARLRAIHENSPEFLADLFSIALGISNHHANRQERGASGRFKPGRCHGARKPKSAAGAQLELKFSEGELS
jgi:hypothetical protein